MRRILIVGSLLLLPVLAAAQTHPHGCFRGGPAERCSWFPLVESGLHYRLTDVVPGDERVMLAWNLGFMKNTGSRTALGAEVWAVAEGDFRAGAALRWRRWLGANTSVDLSAGIHIAGDASSGHVTPGSPMIQLKINRSDLIAASARFDPAERQRLLYLLQPHGVPRPEAHQPAGVCRCRDGVIRGPCRLRRHRRSLRHRAHRVLAATILRNN